MNLVGIAGAAGSGKDTVADILVVRHGFVKIGLADPMKRFCKEIFNFTDEQLWGASEMRNKPDGRYVRPLDEQAKMATGEHFFLTPRLALQTLGTQWGRAMYENVWISKALEVARRLLEHELEDRRAAKVCFDAGFPSEMEMSLRYSPQHGVIRIPEPPVDIEGVVISDVRFPNELQAIRAAGGHIWHRPGGGIPGAHASEVGFGNLKFDVEIPWEEDVTKLQAVVARLMETEKT